MEGVRTNADEDLATAGGEGPPQHADLFTAQSKVPHPGPGGRGGAAAPESTHRLQLSRGADEH